MRILEVAHTWLLYSFNCFQYCLHRNENIIKPPYFIEFFGRIAVLRRWYGIGLDWIHSKRTVSMKEHHIYHVRLVNKLVTYVEQSVFKVYHHPKFCLSLLRKYSYISLSSNSSSQKIPLLRIHFPPLFEYSFMILSLEFILCTMVRFSTIEVWILIILRLIRKPEAYSTYSYFNYSY